MLCLTYAMSSTPFQFSSLKYQNLGGVFNGNDNSEKEICYGSLGCFGTGYPFLDPPYRGVSVLPESPESIGTTFYLNTRKNPSVPQVLDNTDGSTVLGSYFDPAKETKIICHGFTEDGNKQWLVDMSMELLNYGDYNVIRTDWGDGSLAFYSVAVANTRVVGAEMSLLIDLIKVRINISRDPCPGKSAVYPIALQDELH